MEASPKTKLHFIFKKWFLQSAKSLHGPIPHVLNPDPQHWFTEDYLCTVLRCLNRRLGPEDYSELPPLPLWKRVSWSIQTSNRMSRLQIIQHQTDRKRKVLEEATKYFTHIEYRAMSGVCRTIDPPPPLHPASVSPPAPKGGGYTFAGRWGGGGSIFRKTPDIGLASYSIISLRKRPKL